MGPFDLSRLRQAPSPSLWVSLRYFSAARVVVAAVLVLMALLYRETLSHEGTNLEAFTATCFAYFLLSVVYARSASLRQQRFTAQVVTQVGSDLLIVTALLVAAGGQRSGIGILYLLPVWGGAILLGPVLTAFLAGLAALLLIGEAVLRMWSTSAGSGGVMQAGLIGAGILSLAVLVNWLARRLLRQEALAQARGVDLLAQQAINAAIIRDMDGGVAILTLDGSLRMLNPAASRLLGAGEGRGEPPAWQHIVAASRAWRGVESHRRDEAVELTLPESAQGRRVRVRFVAPHPEGLPAAASDVPRVDLVCFIDDLGQIEQRAQQLKLASMGRLTASIAHEIRNPLAAIRHANSLLAEDVESLPGGPRLARIIEDNSVRINRIIEDILSISRGQRATLEEVDLAVFVAAAISDWLSPAGLPADRVRLQIDPGLTARFDSGHLRQILDNLVGNALRYASDRAGAVQIHAEALHADLIELCVIDDGPGLPEEVQRHVFEPFFTTERRGTGLGLFIARELCAVNGASIDYRCAQGMLPAAFVMRMQRVRQAPAWNDWPATLPAEALQAASHRLPPDQPPEGTASVAGRMSSSLSS